MKTRWIVQKSHKVAGPDEYEVETLEELRELLQDRADSYISTDEHPPLGELEFRYELDDGDEPFIIHVYFYNKRGDRTRFARLVRDDDV
jgi:hypothetical protein